MDRFQLIPIGRESINRGFLGIFRERFMGYINEKTNVKFVEATVKILVPTLFDFTCPRCKTRHSILEGMYKADYAIRTEDIGVVTMFFCTRCSLVMTVIGRDDDAIMEAEWGEWEDDRTGYKGVGRR